MKDVALNRNFFEGLFKINKTKIVLGVLFLILQICIFIYAIANIFGPVPSWGFFNVIVFIFMGPTFLLVGAMSIAGPFGFIGLIVGPIIGSYLWACLLDFIGRKIFKRGVMSNTV
jgi:hypothetical protein